MKITRENYEAYYLDFLEGNSSNEDSLLLKEFLALNTDLIEEEDALLFLEKENNAFEFKSDLKQFDIRKDIISHENCEYFLIAQTEGLLTDEKNSELEAFMAGSIPLKNDKKYFALAKLKTDSTIVFSNKGQLKQKEKIVLWPWISGVASAAAVVLVFLQLNTTSTNGIYASQDLDFNEIESLATIDYAVNDSTVEPKAEVNTIEDEEYPIKSSPKKFNTGIDPVIFPTEERIILVSNQKVELKQVPRVELPVILDYDYSIPENTVAVLAPSELNNPLKPITDIVGKVVNTDVDYGVQKSEKQGNKFYFKFGKFEILRKS